MVIFLGLKHLDHCLKAKEYSSELAHESVCPHRRGCGVSSIRVRYAIFLDLEIESSTYSLQYSCMV